MILEDVLQQLVSAQLIRRLNTTYRLVENDEFTYWFKHTLTQETAYQSLLMSHRRQIHRAIAHAIEELYLQDSEEYASLLAQHYAQAGDDAKTLVYALEAGDAAARMYANAEALTEYERALRAVKHSPSMATSDSLCHLYLKRGRVLEISSHNEDALANYKEMQALALERDDPALELEALMAQSTLHSVPGIAQEPLLARGLSTQALALAQELGNRQAQAKIYWNLMLLENWGEGTPEQAIEFGEKSLAIAREFDLREQLAYTLNDLAMAYMTAGRVGEAWSALESGLEMFRTLDNKTTLAQALLRAAMLSAMSGSFQKAHALSEQGLELSASIDDQTSQTLALYILSHIHWELGESERVIDYASQCIDMAEKAKAVAMALGAHALLAWVLGSMGQLDRSLGIIQMAKVTNRSFHPVELSPDAWSAMLQAAWAHVEILSGTFKANPVFAEEKLTPRSEYISLVSVDGYMVFIASAELALVRGEYARAVEVMDQLIAALAQVHIRPYEIHALYLKGKALLALGDTDCAVEVWETARREAEAMGSRTILWQVLFELSKVEEERRHAGQAETLRVRARELVKYIADHAPDELSGSFLNLQDVRAILA